jgi:hypothetical protein
MNAAVLRRFLPLIGFLALAMPRVVRLAHPQVWLEDESYLNGALMLSRGFLPYRDFPLPHVPALELLLAAVLRLAPPTVRTAEILTQTAAFLGSVCVFALARRLRGALTGAFAAMIFATSALLFRYHVFEREVFVVVPVLAAVLLVSPRDPQSATTARGVAAGALIFAALAIKLTAVAPLAAITLQLWIERRRRLAAAVACTALALLAVSSVALAAAFGTDFVVQVFLFRAVHAAFPSLAVKLTEMTLTMDVSLSLGVAGGILIVWAGETRRFAGPLMQLACGVLVLVVLNPTYWAHTGIELLPWLSIAGGYLAATAVCALRPGAPIARPCPTRFQVAACLAVAALMLIYVAPIRNLNWEAGDDSRYGFGYRDRSELETVAREVRAHSAPDARVATPSILAFLADRVELTPYPEIAGEIEELTASVRHVGYIAAWREANRRGLSFWESVEASRDRGASAIEAALAAHRIAVVINDSPDDLMPVRFVDVTPQTLVANRYQLASVSAHYEVWIAE